MSTAEMTLEQFGLDGLSRGERANLATVLMDSLDGIAPSTGRVPHLSESQVAEIRRRIAMSDADPSTLIPFEVIRARMEAKL